jgi:hypothetical protein
MQTGWGNDPCPATAPDGQRCVLAPGHDGNHLTAAQKALAPARPMSDNQKTALILMALVTLGAVALVFLQVKAGLDAML